MTHHPRPSSRMASSEKFSQVCPSDHAGPPNGPRPLGSHSGGEGRALRTCPKPWGLGGRDQAAPPPTHTMEPVPPGLSLPPRFRLGLSAPPSLLVTDLFPAPDKGNSARQPEAPEYSSPRPPSWALKTRRNVALCVLAADLEGYLSSLGVGGTF